jgi:glycosyltransferase involved in cell wall biosynthesis
MTPRILLSAYQCAPGQGSVSQIGWEWYSRLARRAPVTLVTHIRNRPHLEAAGAPRNGSEIIYIDTEWFARRLYGAARVLFPGSEHSVFLLSSLDFFVYDRAALRTLEPRRSEWDVVHLVTPVSPSAHSVLGRLGLPVVRGPLNGGLRTPPNFPEFMRADSAWLYSLRELARPLQAILNTPPSATFYANQSTWGALSPAERKHAERLPEIAVDPACFPAAPWPAHPSPALPLQVLFVGRLIPAKALPLLFEGARRVLGRVPIEITVIGDGPMRPTWEAAAKTFPYRVRFLGSRNADAVSAAFAACHVFCLPSIRESGGAVLLEAMSAARPVIAVNYGGPAELVNESVGRLVPADSSESVAAGIAAALGDVIARPDEWRRRGLAGRRYVLLQHTWDQRVQRGLALYRQKAA